MATSSFYQSSGSSPAAENTIDEQVTAAQTAATTAQTASTEATTSATSAASSLTSFQTYYLGAFAVAPSTSQQGAMYFDLSSNQLKIWSGSAWEITASTSSIGDTDDVSEGVSNLYFTNERVDDRVNGLLVAGSNVTLTYDDTANTLTIDSTGGGGSGSSTFLGLLDTPSAFAGADAEKFLRVNQYYDSVEFYDLTGNDLDMQGNKVLFGNMYSAEGDLPSASTYHGMFAHVHGTGKGYFAHGGSCHKLLDETSSTTDDLTEGASNLYYTDARADARIAAAGHLSDITGESLYDLSNVNTSASPADGQVLAWDNANSYWTPVAASSGGGGISLSDISVTTNTAGTAALSYNSTTGVFAYTPPDLTSYATTASLASVATSGAYSDLTGTPSLSGYLTDITAESLADLSDVDSTTPTDGQVLTWDNANSYWKPVTASGGGSSIDYIVHGTDADSSGNPTANTDNALAIGYGAEATAADTVAIGNKAKATGSGAIRIGLDSNVTGLPASGTGAISIGWGSNGSGYLGLALGYSSNATASTSMAIGANTYATHSKSIALGYGADTSATNQLMLGDAGTTYGFSSIRVGNTSYTPTDNMDLATKKYVDDNAGGGGSANIVTGTFTTTSTTYVDAGELLDTDDGFIGAVEVLLHATRGTGTSMKTTLLPCLFCFNPGNPSVSNWTTFPTIGNAGSGSYEQLGFVSFRFDTSTNKLYLQVKNNAATSTVYNWTAKIV